jgi:copper homeostasis protein
LDQFMRITTEVCIDNVESLIIATQAGAGRIELCASLEVGGLTPSIGLMSMAKRHASVPVYSMIRARQGDFLFSQSDKEQMLLEIHSARQIGLDGVVIGALNKDGTIDTEFCTEAIRLAGEMGVTFHRAIDHCNDALAGLEAILSLGAERVLTSGCAATAEQGINTLQKMVKQANGKLSVMAGAGVNATNVSDIVTQTGVHEVHLSGKSIRESHMAYRNPKATMGNREIDDFTIPITDYQLVRAVTCQFEDEA